MAATALRSMLPGAPWLIAHKSMLKPHQPFKVSLLGQDYVLWQDATGMIQALPNACPHMGAMLSEGWCEDGKVVCPYHALAFDGTGCTVLPGANQQTLSQLEPLPLIIQGDFIWSYGPAEPALPIPTIANEIAQDYEFLGISEDIRIRTDLLNLLLIMHDYNHQNGTHRSLFRIESVEFKQFIDNGLSSHAYYDMPRSQPTFQEIRQNPAVLLMPKVLEAHLENHFPSLVIFRGEATIGSIRQVHVMLPESVTHSRTYVLLYGKAKSPLFKFAKQNIIDLATTVLDQDRNILEKTYSDHRQKIKLNNEVGINWVRRNFASFPEVTAPNLSRT
jgi:phenylpropionate dioxygenase-like ring-hydroxylating dioxygenase large terminal subunit